jgi:hypothetical protein
MPQAPAEAPSQPIGTTCQRKPSKRVTENSNPLAQKNPSLVSVLQLNPVQGRLLQTLLGAQMLQHLSPLPVPLPIPSSMLPKMLMMLDVTCALHVTRLG